MAEIVVEHATKRCCRCHQNLPQTSFRRTSARSLFSYCAQCTRNYKTEQMNTLRGFLAGLLWNSRFSAKVRGRTDAARGEHTLTHDDVMDMWVEQDGRCYYTGITMVHTRNTAFAASLERLDVSRGYHKDNTVLCIIELNSPKPWTQAKLAQLIHEIDHDLDEVDSKLFSDALTTKRSRKALPASVRSRTAVEINGLVMYTCGLCHQTKTEEQFRKGLIRCKVCHKARVIEDKSDIRAAVLARLQASRERARNAQKSIDAGKRFGEAMHTLTVEQLLGKLAEQRGMCAYSGIRLRYGRNADFVLSLERIDSQKGYHIDNVVWIAREFNVSERTAGKRITEEQIAHAVDHDGLNRDKVQTIIQALRVKLNKPVLSQASDIAQDNNVADRLSALSL